jgi:pyridoxamine 5'-phosphate oxidase
MTSAEVYRRLEELTRTVGAAVFATVDSDGTPRMRWMTPILVPGRPRTIYALSRPGTRKVQDLERNDRTCWLFQTKGLEEAVRVTGQTLAVDNAALRGEVLECAGSRMTVFWNVDREHDEVVVLETAIREAVVLEPMRGRSEIVTF